MELKMKDGWFITSYFCPDCGARMVSKTEDIMSIEVWDEYPIYCSKCGKKSTVQEGKKMEEMREMRDMEERTVGDLPDGKARSHALHRMEDTYTKVQKVYSLMGTGFGKMTIEDMDTVCSLLYDSYSLMVHARRDLRFGFDKD